MGAQLGSKGSFNDINMTPLIDIVLVVLIIMMVNIPIQVNEMGVKLPSKTEKPPPETQNKPQQLVIAIYENGDLALNRKLIAEEPLFFEMTRRLRNMEKKNAFVDAHPTVNYGRVVDMMDLAREAGAAKVGLAKLKESGPVPATSVDSGALPKGVHPGSPSVVGAMDEVSADLALKPLLPNIMKCYSMGLAQDPQLTGRVMAMVTVGPEGELMSNKVTQSSLSDPKEADAGNNPAGLIVDQCISELLPALTFEPLGPQKTARVLYPLLFSPG
jgi:biopolymer transport protein ExbD